VAAPTESDGCRDEWAGRRRRASCSDVGSLRTRHGPADRSLGRQGRHGGKPPTAYGAVSGHPSRMPASVPRSCQNGRKTAVASGHGRFAQGHTCCGAGSPGLYLASGRRGRGCQRRYARTCASAVVRSVAELCLTGSRRRLRRRGPGVSGGLCLGRPARRTPGRTSHARRSRWLKPHRPRAGRGRSPRLPIV